MWTRLRRAGTWALAFVLITLVIGIGSTRNARPAAAQPVPGEDGVVQPGGADQPVPGDDGVVQPGGNGPGATKFRWDSETQKAAFRVCLEITDRVAGGTGRRSPAPDGTSDEDPTWRAAIDWDWLMGIHIQQFTYTPRCHLLLPGDWLTRVPSRFWSEAFNRCLARTQGFSEDQNPRPQAVPAWYWEVSIKIGSCWLMLPKGAFDLGDEANGWSSWTADDEIHYPTTSPNPHTNEAFALCKEYIGWRMNGAATFRGLGSKYGDPPEGSVPPRVWQRALDYWTNTESASGDPTVPNRWNPNCGLLMLSRPCDTTPDSGHSLVPELCVGGHATSQYDIGYSEYPNPDDDKNNSRGTPSISRNLWGVPTMFTFFLGKESIHVALWMVDWGYSFNIAQLNPMALHIGDSYQNDLVDQDIGVRIQDLFWLILFSWAGFTALRGRLGMAGGELAVTFVMLLLAGFLVSHRAMYMNATWDLMTQSSNTLLEAGMHSPETSNDKTQEELIKDVQAKIHHVFVEQTYDYLNWGQDLGDASDANNPLRVCAATRFDILDQGPHGSDPWPRQMMRRAGHGECAGLAEFNRNPSGTRLMGAILMMISAVLVAILLGLMALTIVIGKFVALLLFAVAPLAAVVTILPGAGRKMAWSWVSALVQVLLAVIGMSFLLSLLLLTLLSVSSLTENVSLIERFLLMNLVVVIVFAARRQMLHAGQRLAGRFAEYMSATRGNGTTWAQAASSAHGTGMNLLAVDRAVRLTVGRTVGAPVSAAGSHVARRLQERRIARRGYRNLVRVSRFKRAENARNAAWIRRHSGQPVPVNRQPLP
jgi:hypothetical protein